MTDTYRGGYTKALLDVLDFFEYHDESLKLSRMYGRKGVPVVLKGLVEARETMMEIGGKDLQMKLSADRKRMFLNEDKNAATEYETLLQKLEESIRQHISYEHQFKIEYEKLLNKAEEIDLEKKVLVKQEKGDSWAIRKSMHKDTGWGEVNLRFKKEVSLNEALKNPRSIVNKDFKQKVLELLAVGKNAKEIKKYVDDNKDVWSDINTSKIEVYYYTKETKDRYFATRFLSDLVSYMSGIKEYDKVIAKIDGITDTGIQKILKAHLQAKGNNPELAFSADGIDEMNRNIVELNGRKPHKPIYKVRRFESGNKYSIGQTGCKAKKFVEADKGTNLFFAVFSSEKLNKETGEMESVRSYLTIPLNVMIDCQKQFGSKWRDNIEAYLKEKELVAEEGKLQFILSPNDLVYLPTKEELKNGIKVVDKKRIYKMVSCTGNQCFFISEKVAKVIYDKVEFSSMNKTERAITGEMIKETCVPLKVDRLGNIVELNGKKL
mgnify:CR=1 FL=1